MSGCNRSMGGGIVKIGGRIAAAALGIACLLGTASCVRSDLKEGRAQAVLPEIHAPESVIYVINRGDLSDAEYTVASSLQGICAQREARIYIEDGENIVFLEQYLKENKGISVQRVADLWTLVRENRDALTDGGCVLFRMGDNTINSAFTIAGMERWLAVPEELAGQAEAIGLEIKQDLTKPDGALTQEQVFEKYQDRLNKNLLVHQSPELVTLRDYAVAAGAFCFYTNEDDRAQVKFREQVFEWANENAIAFGWSADELGYVKQASGSAIAVIPSDHCSNLSLLSSLKLREPIHQKNSPEQVTAQEGKHYIALVMSDGDNAQWYETTVPFRDHYYDRVQTAGDYKLSWTAPPMLYRLAPTVLQYVYNMATDRDRFVCGVSGLGYINPTRYPEAALEHFAAGTVQAMRQADLQVVTILDNSTSTHKLGRALEAYAVQESLSGGLMQIEDKYEALDGKMVISGGKPFVSVKKSFWFTSENQEEKISREWIEDFAQELNALPCDIRSEEGYSYINIHPWSTSIEDLNLLVSLLDDHIEIVYAEELLAMIAENVIQD